jgi:hypothetical protein
MQSSIASIAFGVVKRHFLNVLRHVAQTQFSLALGVDGSDMCLDDDDNTSLQPMIHVVNSEGRGSPMHISSHGGNNYDAKRVDDNIAAFSSSSGTGTALCSGVIPKNMLDEEEFYKRDPFDEMARASVRHEKGYLHKAQRGKCLNVSLLLRPRRTKRAFLSLRSCSTTAVPQLSVSSRSPRSFFTGVAEYPNDGQSERHYLRPQQHQRSVTPASQSISLGHVDSNTSTEATAMVTGQTGGIDWRATAGQFNGVHGFDRSPAGSREVGHGPSVFSTSTEATAMVLRQTGGISCNKSQGPKATAANQQVQYASL